MPQANFYLKKAEGSPARSLIYLQMKYAGRKLVYSFGQTIAPGSWNKKKQCVKSNAQTTADGQLYLNDLLASLKKAAETAYNSLIKDGTPETREIKRRLDEYMNSKGATPNKPTLFSLVKRFVDGEITYRGASRKTGTIKGYGTTYNHLQAFAKSKKIVVDFETVTLDMYYQFVAYLTAQGLGPNSRGKEIKNLKTFMAEGVDLGYTNNMQFRHKKFAVTRQETDAVYLTWNEVFKLYRHDLSDHKRLERVRDLFVFGCCVGLRFSDFSAISPNHIIKEGEDYFIKLRTQKSGEVVIIPCNPLVLDIFRKYQSEKNTLPPAVSNQKFNDYIKECCVLAGLDEPGRLGTEPDLQLWECVSSHTARRSCLTNYYLEGFPVIDLMKISGHKTEKAFLTYIKVSKLDVAKRLQAHIKKNWSEKLLRVAG